MAVITGGNVISNGMQIQGSRPRMFATEGAPVVGTTYPGQLAQGDFVVDVDTRNTYEHKVAGTDEVQTATVTGAPTGGSFTLTFAGQTTTALAHNATAAVVRAALEALSTIGAGNVTVTLAGNVYTVTFVGALGRQDVAAMTATANLTGGTTPSVTVATATAGSASVPAASFTRVDTV